MHFSDCNKWRAISFLLVRSPPAKWLNPIVIAVNIPCNGGFIDTNTQCGCTIYNEIERSRNSSETMNKQQCEWANRNWDLLCISLVVIIVISFYRTWHFCVLLQCFSLVCTQFIRAHRVEVSTGGNPPLWANMSGYGCLNPIRYPSGSHHVPTS